MSIRALLRSIAAAALAAACHAATAQALLLGVSEGTSGGLDHAQVIAKYQGLADTIGRAVRQKVEVVFVREFEALEEGMKSGRFDFVMARPSDYPARGLRDYGYRYVASAKPDGQCFIVVPKGSPIKSLAEAKGKRFVIPEQISYMSKFCRAELRDRGIELDKQRVQYVREQGAVAFYLENGFGDIGGLASYSGPARSWEKNGNIVLHKSVTQPYFPLIANKRMGDAQVGAVQRALKSLPSDESGRAVLKSVGVNEFDVGTETKLRELLKWLGV
ncbi:MAG: phosphate/phosphite/phosphonate ABC transporter substrate-binding protein [Pseudomonadota bacterium]|nr:phosphate/phosphite/phosphonate ABC transporter substrate-binding protein [Pseudomonadota bacterium]